MEEFASLGQYLFMFGTGALKLPDFGREVSLSSFIRAYTSNHVYSHGMIVGTGDGTVDTAVGVG